MATYLVSSRVSFILLFCFFFSVETKIQPTSHKRIYKHGDIVIAGMFPFHTELRREDGSLESGPIRDVCSSFFPEGYRLAEAMIFAIEEVNLHTNFVPGLTLGYDIRDSCGSVAPSAETAIDLITPLILGDQSIKAVVGASRSSVSTAVNAIFGMYNIPFISYGSTSVLLNNRLRYKSFLRTIPSDLSQSLAMVELVDRFGWEWIATIATDDDYGRPGIQQVINGVTERGVCVAFSELFPTHGSERKATEIVSRLRQDPSIKVVVTFIQPSGIQVILKEAVRQGVTDRIWLACETWSDNPGVAVDKYYLTEGTIGVVLSHGHIPGFAEYLRDVSPFRGDHKNPFLEELWEEEFGCRLSEPVTSGDLSGESDDQSMSENGHETPTVETMNGQSISNTSEETMTENETSTYEPTVFPHTVTDSRLLAEASSIKPGLDTVQTTEEHLPICTDNHSFNETQSYKSSSYRITYNVYLAVYAIGQAVDDIIKCEEPHGLLENGTCPNVTDLQPWQLLKYIHEIQFNLTDGTTYNLVDNEEGKGRYEINNWQNARDDGIDLVTIGHFDGGAESNKLELNDDAIRWYNGSTKVPKSICSIPCPPGTRKALVENKPHCCFDCVPCAEGEMANTTGAVFCSTCPSGYWSNWDKTACIMKTVDYLQWAEPAGIILEVLVTTGVVSTLLCTGAFIYHRDTPIIKACNRELSYLMLFFLLCCYFGCVAYLGLPSDIHCIARIANGIAYTGCVAILFVKTQRLVSIFNADLTTSLARRRLAGLKYQFLIVFAFLLVHIALVVATYVIAPPIVEYNSDISKAKTYVQCKATSLGLVLSTSIYTWVLAGICLTLAFRARKLPTNFNEAKFITFAMFMYFSVWSIYYPVSFWTYGKLKALSQAIVILVSSTCILVCIFLPKLYIIIFKPEFNTKASIRQETLKHAEKQLQSMRSIEATISQHVEPAETKTTERSESQIKRLATDTNGATSGITAPYVDDITEGEHTETSQGLGVIGEHTETSQALDVIQVNHDETQKKREVSTSTTRDGEKNRVSMIDIELIEVFV